MVYVRVHRRVLLTRTRGLLFEYAPGRGVAPQAHIEEIVDRGAGVRLTKRGDGPKSAAELDAIEERLRRERS